MGTLAYIDQVLSDTRYYTKAKASYEAGPLAKERPTYDLALEALEMPGYRALSKSDMLPWTHKLMTEHHPQLARASLALSGVVFVLLAAVAAVGWRRAGIEPGTRIDMLLPWIPAIAFALANGAAFALHADAVSPRYTVTAHAMLLAAVYASALRWEPAGGRR